MAADRARLGTALGLLAALAYAWAGSAPRPFTPAADVVTFLPGVLVAAVAALQWRLPGRLPSMLCRRPGPRHSLGEELRAVQGWVLIVAAATALELVELAQLPRSAHPTASSLLAPLLAVRAARWVGFAGWLLLGAWMTTR